MPRHGYQIEKWILPTNHTSESFLLKPLRDFTIYCLSLSGESSDGQVYYGDTVEVKTAPRPPRLRFSTATPSSIIIFFDTGNFTRIPKWGIEYRVNNSPSRPVRECGAFGSKLLTGLTPNTMYEVRAHALEILATQETEKYNFEFSDWFKFTTDSPSIFGRVILADQIYNDSYSVVGGEIWNKIENRILKEYSNQTGENSIVNISIIEVEKEDTHPLVHYRIKVTDKVPPAAANYTIKNSTRFSSCLISNRGRPVGTPVASINGSHFEMEYESSSGSECDCRRSYINLLAATEEGDTVKVQLYSEEKGTGSVDLRDIALVSGAKKENLLVGFIPDFLVKDCNYSSTICVYREYFEAVNRTNSSISIHGFFSITGSFLPAINDVFFIIDDFSIEMGIPAVRKAVKYDVIDASNASVLATLDTTDIDGSDVAKINISRLSLDGSQTIVIIVTFGTYDITMRLPFDIQLNPDRSQCAVCGRASHCWLNYDSSVVFCMCYSNRREAVCDGIFECEDEIQSCKQKHELCSKKGGSFECVCKPGFAEDGASCIDINECLDTRFCHQDASCSNTVGSYNCTCRNGFIGDGKTCIDIDECADNAHDCDPNANCINVKATFECQCKNGYTGDGRFCKDIDECRGAHECDGNSTCHNVAGSYNCTCHRGFISSGHKCEVIDECIPYPCEKFNRSRCHNLFKNYSCSCLEGYSGDGYNICGRPDKVQLTRRELKELKYEGYVEILARPDGVWRTICDPNWSTSESNVTCRMLGYERAHYLLPNITEDPLITNTWLDKVKCNGNETSLKDCELGVFGTSHCKTKTERVKIRCSNSTSNNGTTTLQYKGLYTFRCKTWEGGRLIQSVQTCHKEGRAASIQCVTFRQFDGTEGVDFNDETMHEFSCNASFEELLDRISKEGNLNDKGVREILGDLSAVTKHIPAGRDPLLITSIVNELYLGLNRSGNDIMKASAFYLLWSTDNFHRVLAEDKRNQTGNLLRRFKSTDKLRFITSLNKMASHLQFEEKNMTIETESILFKARRLEGLKTEFEGNTGEGRENVSATIRHEILDNPSGNKTLYLNAYLHKDSILFPRGEKSDTKPTEVLSVEFTGAVADNSTQDIEFTLPNGEGEKAKIASEVGALYFYRCAYLDLKTSKWESDNCITVEVTNNKTECKCIRDNQVIAFSALVKTYDVDDSVPLGVAGMIGCVSSVIGLVMLLAVYLHFKSLRKNPMNQIHMNLHLCLLISYLTFLSGIQRSRNYVSCMSVASLLHFSFLSSWAWMLVESITMYRKFVLLSRETGKNYVVKCGVLVYMISSATVVTNTTAASQIDKENWRNWNLAFKEDVVFRPSIYIADKMCWIHLHSLYFGFLAPIGLILILNIIVCSVVMRRICTSGATIRSTKTKVDAKEHLTRTLAIALLLGIPWAFGVPLALTDVRAVNAVFGWLFTLFCAYQGFLIFLIFGVRNREVRGLVSKQFRKIAGRWSTKDGTSTPSAKASVAYSTKSSTKSVESTDANKKVSTNNDFLKELKSVLGAGRWLKKDDTSTSTSRTSVVYSTKSSTKSVLSTDERQRQMNVSRLSTKSCTKSVGSTDERQRQTNVSRVDRTTNNAFLNELKSALEAKNLRTK